MLCLNFLVALSEPTKPIVSSLNFLLWPSGPAPNLAPADYSVWPYILCLHLQATILFLLLSSVTSFSSLSLWPSESSASTIILRPSISGVSFWASCLHSVKQSSTCNRLCPEGKWQCALVQGALDWEPRDLRLHSNHVILDKYADYLSFSFLITWPSVGLCY